MSVDPRAGLIIRGRIATLAGSDGPGWVEAVAIADGRVLAAGMSVDVERLADAGTRRIELPPDAVAIPGLTDAHLHLVEAALARARVDLHAAASLDVALDRVAEAAAAQPDPDRWVEGSGWDADRFGRWPTADDLERVAPGRLVALWAHDHHALLVSLRALTEAGIDPGRTDPQGGVIRRDADGRPTGVLHETAARLVSARIPPPDEATIEAAVRPLAQELLGLGVVAVHDPGGLALQDGLRGPIAAYRHLAATDALELRVHPCIRPEQLDAAEAEGIRSGSPLGPDPRGRLRMGWLKTFADGTLGSRTAALLDPLQPVAGEPPPPNDGYGVWMVPPDALREQAARAAALGIATQIHAIGDAAVGAALDALAPTVGVNAADAPRGARPAHRGCRRGAVRGARDRGVHATDPRPVGRREGAPPVGSARGWSRLCPGRACPGRRGRPGRHRRPGRAGGPVARDRLRRHSRRAVMAGGHARLRTGQRAVTVAVDPGELRRPGDQRGRRGPGTADPGSAGRHRGHPGGGDQRARRG